MLGPHARCHRISALALALLSLPFDMHLTRVSGASSQQASQVVAAGGNGDLLALLLGGTGEASAAFPLTLDAALAGGSVEEPLGELTDEACSGTGGDGILPIDAGLAAALALGGALASAVAVDAAAVEGEGTAPAVDATSAVGTTVATASETLIAPGAGVSSGPEIAGTAVGAGEAAVDNAPAPVSPDAPAVAPSEDTPRPARVAPAAPGTEGSTPIGTASASAAPTADDRTSTTPSSQRSSTETTTVRELAAAAAQRGQGADDTDSAPSFEHRGERDTEHGTFERTAAAVSADALTADGSAKLTLTVTTPGAAGEALHATRTAGAEPGATAAVQASTAGNSTSAPTHATPTGHAERPALAHGAIEPRWSERVTDAVRLSALRGGGEIRLQLEPEGLGHIDVRLDLHADGVRAVIVAEHESTRALLQSQQQVLHEAFGKSDLRLSGFSVDVGSGGAASSHAGADGGERGHAPAPAPSTPTTVATDAVAGDNSTLGNGRVNVRV